jgi:hypothetical protein
VDGRQYAEEVALIVDADHADAGASATRLDDDWIADISGCCAGLGHRGRVPPARRRDANRVEASPHLHLVSRGASGVEVKPDHPERTRDYCGRFDGELVERRHRGDRHSRMVRARGNGDRLVVEQIGDTHEIVDKRCTRRQLLAENRNAVPEGLAVIGRYRAL